MSIDYIRETRNDHAVSECLVVNTISGQHYIVSTLKIGSRRFNTQAYATGPNATGHNYMSPVLGAGGERKHRCQTMRELERLCT